MRACVRPLFLFLLLLRLYDSFFADVDAVPLPYPVSDVELLPKLDSVPYSELRQARVSCGFRGVAHTARARARLCVCVLFLFPVLKEGNCESYTTSYRTKDVESRSFF